MNRRQLLAHSLLLFGLPSTLLAACDLDDAQDAAKSAKQAAEKAVTAVSNSKRDFQFASQPVSGASATNWYGNTQLSYEHRRDWYNDVQGFHSGVDWLVPVGTLVRTGIASQGVVISVGGKPFDWKAAPNAVAIDYGEYIVLYGHLSKPEVTVGAKTGEATIVGRSGVGQGTAHLHVEVIFKDLSAKQGERPGNIRTNPVRFLSGDVRDAMAAKIWDTFHANPGNKWLKPREQPDIHPGSPLFFE